MQQKVSKQTSRRKLGVKNKGNKGKQVIVVIVIHFTSEEALEGTRGCQDY